MAHELTRVAGVASVEVTLRRWSRRARWRVYVGELKRPLPDSNRGWRICNPLPYRLAKGPCRWHPIGPARASQSAHSARPLHLESASGRANFDEPVAREIGPRRALVGARPGVLARRC